MGLFERYLTHRWHLPSRQVLSWAARPAGVFCGLRAWNTPRVNLLAYPMMVQIDFSAVQVNEVTSSCLAWRKF